MFKLIQRRNFSSAVLHFSPGDLTSATSYKGEVYPVVVLENVVADKQKLVTLMSASGRISYSSDAFLRFWAPEFVNKALLESKDRLQGRMKTFSRDMVQILGSNREIFKEVTEETLRRDGIIYEGDLFKQVFGDADRVVERFALHKFLFEGQEWIKDGQWTVNSMGSGPYILRPQWQQELLCESQEALKQFSDVESFRKRVKASLGTKMTFKVSSRFDELIMKCLKTFSDEFYVNATGSPFKNLASEAFLGVAIIDSQSQAKSLLNLLEAERNWIKEPSKPLLNSYINERQDHRDLPVFKTESDVLKCGFHDFGDLPVYLIDPVGTVEVDDGISVERVNASQVLLHVHVADPSEFVTGRIEEEAKFRSGTIYLPESKIPMLPDSITALSTLKQGGIKTLTFTCKIDLTSGEVLDHQIRRGIINNLNHFTYEEAEIITGNPDIELLKSVRQAHLKYRNSRGHLNFSFPRGLAQLDRENEKILVNIEDDKLVMKNVVAEAMIIAGRIAGEYLKEHKLPGPFRNHQLVHENEIRDDMSLLEKYQVLKTIVPASVDYEPKRHESMGLDAYVKVTSPLRRYLDLVTHKILKAGDSSHYGKEWFISNLGAIHRQEVYNKRLASSVNRFWIEKYIWQQHRDNMQELWTLTPLEKFKEGMWMVHVNEVGSNFLVTLRGKEAELGGSVKSRLIGKSHETLLKFETISPA